MIKLENLHGTFHNHSTWSDGLETIETMAEAARDPNNHGYSKSNGIPNLRREIASKYLKKYGVRLDPDAEVITCLGSKEGFSHMCLALMGAGSVRLARAERYGHALAGFVVLACGAAIKVGL